MAKKNFNRRTKETAPAAVMEVEDDAVVENTINENDEKHESQFANLMSVADRNNWDIDAINKELADNEAPAADEKTLSPENLKLEKMLEEKYEMEAMLSEYQEKESTLTKKQREQMKALSDTLSSAPFSLLVDPSEPAPKPAKAIQGGNAKRGRRFNDPAVNELPHNTTVQFKTTKEMQLTIKRWATNNDMQIKEVLLEGFALMQEKYGR